MDTNGWIAIAGIAGTLIGAGLGAGGAILSARITGDRQARATHDQWRRQMRRDAYARFITVTLPAFETLHAVRNAVTEEGWLGPGIDQQRADLEGHLRELREALVIVNLEGPESVSTAADQGFVALAAAARLITATGQVTDGNPISMPGQLPNLLDEAGRLLDVMRIEVQGLLDHE
ncbi:hypothetical protein ACFYY1_35285 [Streptomyces sp. NPDC001890]|uniref:hypothetical protein n=1 Tax=Streptomyces sp. NPDC001890 TaxID=3364620 RepID=UPI0036886E67